MINDIIVSTAIKYIGEHEKPGNAGFLDPVFEKKMKECGWSLGQAWCAYTAELIYKEAYEKYKPEYKGEINRLFSASATSTYKNFDIDKDWDVSKTPVKGALVVWRHGTGWQGHIGVVSDIVDIDFFKSIEGNTNAAGGREGVEVAEKVRPLDWRVGENKLNLVGFIIPKI